MAENVQTSLQTILDQFRDDARNNRDLGDRFEWMMQQFFRVDPLYAGLFSDVWMWNDWPLKGQVGDVGVDLVAQHRATGEYFAIQCKFYLPDHTISKADIDSFFTALGKPLLSQGIIVSTTDNWGKNALDALNQTKPVARIGIPDLEASPIDWSQFDNRKQGNLKRTKKNAIRPHQKAALDDVIKGLAEADRGKLIMACGTGKTFTALKIAETLTPKLAGKGKPGHVLFLVPSLSLMAQTLREWSAQAQLPMQSLAVCSDVSIGKRHEKASEDSAEITIYDLPFPATTNDRELAGQYKKVLKLAELNGEPGLVVVFSTYQSIEAVSKAQTAGLPSFDLIICDEAHRTTGVTLTGEDESSFVKVHDANFLKAAKRLYMTATPRIYGDDAKSKAKQASAEIASMDNVHQFGQELHRLGFGEAVSKSLLSDYKVLVLAVDEKYVSKTFQKQIASKDNELNLEDATKITGCWNGLEKRFEAAKSDVDFQGDVQPMRRAVAFSRSIKDSKKFVEQFGQIVSAYKEAHPDTETLEIEADHVDGTFDALKRGALLDWLKAESPANTCRILSNARCLSEGVDVPALDAVLFLNPRNSVIDVVQSVGRVMRRAEGKRYGYIILPIGIPADKTPEEALRDNEKYKVVWQVLQALRAHDDRFNATINQLELNKNRPDNIQVIGVGGGTDDEAKGAKSDGDSKPKVREVQGVFAFPNLDEWKDAIYAKMVMKVGERAYWETWAKDIATIAQTHITRIKALLDDPKSKQSKAFETFLKGLQQNLNPAVSRQDAIEMLAQHLITKPVFDALFAHYPFTQHNPVSQSMQKMLDILDEQAMEKETATLDKFYASVKDRAAGIDNAEGRQKVIYELYEEFFKNAFKDLHERLGIVYTPVEVVDFIIKSVEDVLRDEFNSGLAEKDVHIIDPFTGTGTFLVRLLQSGLIPPEKLLHKYKHELHANEIVLLAYYIAAINIEETFHGLMSVEAASRRLNSEEKQSEDKRRDAASTTVGYFNPTDSVGHLTGNLPHWRQDGTTYFVTFRLADSLPQEKLDQWLRERETWLKANPEPHSPQQRKEYDQQFPQRFQEWLDAGYGSCVLNIPQVKALVENALNHFDGERYHLDEFVIMPNHVHVLVTPIGTHTLSDVLHSWKSFTAKEISKVEAASRRLSEARPKRRDAASTTVWQKESFDHIVRNPDSLEKFRQYIRENPGVEAASRRLNSAETVEAASRLLNAEDEDKRRDAASTYVPFEGICLTDTFQLYESGQQQIEGTFPENTERVKRQKASPIRVVIANPPYSANQGDANNNNQNLKYPALDARIAATYAARSTAINKNSVYDSYIRAIRWASDRIHDRGVVGFVTNGYFIDGNAMDGLRACLCNEFQSIHIFNLRGNARTSGEIRQLEAGNVFGGGARTPVAITLLVKNPAKKGQCTLRYHDIGDSLTREEKLKIIRGFASIRGIENANRWTQLAPNDDHDWINQRDPGFGNFAPMGEKENDANPVASTFWRGLETSRDAWCYNFSCPALKDNVRATIKVFNDHVQRFPEFRSQNPEMDVAAAVDEFVDNDAKKISWSRAFKRDVAKGTKYRFDEHGLRVAQYRPFCKMFAYLSRQLNNMVGAIPDSFPNPGTTTPTICVTSPGNRDSFSTLICEVVPDLHMADKSGASQCFPLYVYEKAAESNDLQFDKSEIIDGYRRRDAITDTILKTFREAYGSGSGVPPLQSRSDVSSLQKDKRRDAASTVTKEDIFYYVYGILHSPEYRTRFAADLKKMLPRIPLTKEAKDFRAYSDAGRALAKWHLNYETVPTWPVEEVQDGLPLDEWEFYKVEKMRFERPTAQQKAAGQKWDKTRIIYNSHITISKIPLEAYEYVVNGKPAIEWVMERYQVTRDKDSGIVNDPNDWCKEHKQPRYIIDLVERVTRVSIETMKIVKKLPALNERTESGAGKSASSKALVRESL